MRLLRVDPLLLALVGLQWLVAVVVAALADHSGWLYGDPGSAARIVGSANAVGHGDLPPGGADLGWSLVLAPIVRITGTSLDSALPAIVGVNILVLGPLLIAAIFEIGTRLGGRLGGTVAAGVWIAAPLASLPLVLPGYRDTAQNAVAPAIVGLTATPTYPAAVALGLAGALALRATRRVDWVTAALAGAAAAFAGLIMAPALGFALAAAAALALARRWHGLAAFSAALIPGLAALAVCRQRELGTITVSLGPVGWNALGDTMASLREYVWSNRLLQFLPVAGTIALVRLFIPGAALLAGWVGAFVVTTAASSSAASSFDGGAFFVSFLPALPPYLVLAAAIPLLVPTLQARLGRRLDPVPMRYDPGAGALAVTLVLLGLLPLVAAVSLSRP